MGGLEVLALAFQKDHQRARLAALAFLHLEIRVNQVSLPGLPISLSASRI
jgi:hypothetical protein